MFSISLIIMPGKVELCYAQDMHFTQFYSSPLYLNPAFTGANVCARIALTYRNQWPGISKAYNSFLFSGDHYFPKSHLGVGLLFGNDVAGTGQLTTTVINPSIAYETKLTRKLAVRFGVQPGIDFKSINYNNLIFGDQIARGGNIPTIENPTQTKTFFDIGAGLILYTAKYWGGVSFFHLNQPNEALFGNPRSPLPLKYSAHGGAKFNLKSKDAKDEFQRKSITAAFNYRGQKEFDQFDIGLYFTRYVFNLGVWYRGIPLLKSYKPGYSNNDAVALIVGFQTDRFNFGYSYDITISRLYKISNGAHEVCISYQVCKLAKKKKYRMIIPCPKF